MPTAPEPAPLFACDDCGREWAAEISLMFCCNPAALGRYGATVD